MKWPVYHWATTLLRHGRTYRHASNHVHWPRACTGAALVCPSHNAQPTGRPVCPWRQKADNGTPTPTWRCVLSRPAPTPVQAIEKHLDGPSGSSLDAYEVEATHERSDVLQDLAEFQLAAVSRAGRGLAGRSGPWACNVWKGGGGVRTGRARKRVWGW